MSASKWIGRSRGVFAGCLVTLLWALQPGFAAELDASGGPAGNRWVTTWSAAQLQPGPLTIDSLIFGNDQSRSFENQTIRHIVAHQRWRQAGEGAALECVRLSAIARWSAHPWRCAVLDASIYPWPPNRRLTFSGQTVHRGSGRSRRWSAMPWTSTCRGARDLAVSVYLPALTEPATYHETDDAGFLHHRRRAISPMSRTCHGPDVDAIDLLPGGRGSAGHPSRSARWSRLATPLPRERDRSLGQSHTWPDHLSARLNPNPSRPRLAVINQGIGCGRLLHDFCGPSGAARFDRDVLSVAGVTSVIVHLGLNDIMIPTTLRAVLSGVCR